MNTEALFLFLILLLGLVLCSFLGGNYNKEGFDLSGDLSSAESSLSNMYNSAANDVDSAYNTTANAVSGAYNTTANTVSGAYNTATSAITSGFDNYNHYTGNSSSPQLQTGMVFNDTSGNTVTVVTNSNGSQNLQLMQVGQSTPMVLGTTPANNSSIQPQSNTFYAPFGNITATVTTDSNGQTAIQFNIPGATQPILFTQSGSSSSSSSSNANGVTSTQYYGSTGYPIQSSGYSLSYQGPYGGSAGSVTGPYGNTAYYAQGPNGNAVVGTYPNNQYYANQYQGPYGGSAGSVTGPYGNTAYYAQGPYGNTVAGTSSNNPYYSTMPQGIPASQIPPGQEDLYILKSEIVPPVCPACPTSAACPRQEPCPPCPACARCPEPSFECKKVPNYNAIDNDYLPAPVLNDFSTFGM